MNDPTMISIFVGIGVIVLIGGAGLVLSKSLGSVAEERLDGPDRANGQGGRRPICDRPPPAAVGHRPGRDRRSGRRSSPTPRT